MQTWRPTTFMRLLTASAPGMVDFFALLEELRARQKPHEKVLDTVATHMKAVITPRTMTAIDEGRTEVVRCLVTTAEHHVGSMHSSSGSSALTAQAPGTTHLAAPCGLCALIWHQCAHCMLAWCHLWLHALLIWHQCAHCTHAWCHL
jgi:hypothetical protein